MVVRVISAQPLTQSSAEGVDVSPTHVSDRTSPEGCEPKHLSSVDSSVTLTYSGGTPCVIPTLPNFLSEFEGSGAYFA